MSASSRKATAIQDRCGALAVAGLSGGSRFESDG